MYSTEERSARERAAPSVEKKEKRDKEKENDLMKKSKKLIALGLTVVMAAGLATGLTGCGGEETGATEVSIVEQYGMAYAPLKVMKEQGLIEKHYEGDVTVNWTTLNSGAAITESFASGDVQVGAMGVGPAVTGALTEGVGFKIASNVSAQPHKIMTNDPSIETLSDIGDKQIALVNVGSIQHILLAMKAKEELGDAHALDENIAAMSHPDGMSALISGSVPLQLTTSPYVFQEEEEGMTVVDTLTDVWPEGNSFIVLCIAESLKEDNPELYDAIVAALDEAITWINENKEEAAKLLCEDEGVDADTMLEWLNDPACIYDTELKGVMDMANFMAEEGFLEVDGAEDISDLAFDGVKGN